MNTLEDWSRETRRSPRFGPAMRSFALIGVTAAVFAAPSLGAGLYDDDFWQRRFILDQLAGTRDVGWWKMFGVPLDPGAVPQLVHQGFLPWWTSPDFQLSFFRPLSVATHFLDYALWPDSPALMHLQNVIMYVCLCLAVYALYRALLGNDKLAWCAGVLYTLDDAHLEAVSWVAARNSLLTALFSVLVLSVFARLTIVPSKRSTCWSVVLISLAHLSSEGALAVWPYVLAWLIVDRSRRAAWPWLMPALLVSAGFALGTRLGDYVVAGTGAYIDARVHPLEFVRSGLDRVPALLGFQFGPPSWFNSKVTELVTGEAYSALLIAGWFTVAYSAVRHTRHAQLWSMAMGLAGSTILVCAGRPEPRLLLLVGVGGHAVLAIVLAALWRLVRGASSRGAAVAAGLGCAWISAQHVLLPLPASVAVPDSYRARQIELHKAASSMQVSAEHSAGVLAILNGPSFFDALSTCTYRQELAPVRPWRAVHILGSSLSGATVTRLESATLRLEPNEGFLAELTSRQARDPAEPFRVGHTVSLDGLEVTVEQTTAEGRARSIRVRWSYTESPQFLTWSASERSFVRVELPQIGGHIAL